VLGGRTFPSATFSTPNPTMITESYVPSCEGGDQPTGIAVRLNGAVNKIEYSVECLQVIGEMQRMLQDMVVNLFYCTVFAFP